MLLSRKTLQRILGVLWLIDGLLQLQPQMCTMNMVNGIMKPDAARPTWPFRTKLPTDCDPPTLHP